jgi:hypothetical protein
MSWISYLDALNKASNHTITIPIFSYIVCKAHW